jgi:hypothetical protein
MRSGIAWCLVIPIQVAALFGQATIASASDASSLCETAAQDAAGRHGIPPHLLRTLTLTETGRTLDGALRPWPWAINNRGQGHWFESSVEMVDFAESLIAAGDTNFDIGCFQLNYRWHGTQFTSVAEMGEPIGNAAYAAAFLQSKFAATGSWREAVGAYHSQTETAANAYLARYEAVFAAWSGVDTPSAQSPVASPNEPEPTINSFPLLISGERGRGASLVPIMEGRLRLIGGNE